MFSPHTTFVCSVTVGVFHVSPRCLLDPGRGAFWCPQGKNAHHNGTLQRRGPSTGETLADPRRRGAAGLPVSTSWWRWLHVAGKKVSSRLSPSPTRLPLELFTSPTRASRPCPMGGRTARHHPAFSHLTSAAHAANVRVHPSRAAPSSRRTMRSIPTCCKNHICRLGRAKNLTEECSTRST